MRIFFRDTRQNTKRLLAVAFFCLTLSPFGAGAAEKIGVLLLHGKGGTTQKIEYLSGKLEDAGFLVEMPTSTPWNEDRIYDRTYPEALKEMDTGIDKLKAAGATRVVIGGHSIGANVALGYAATRKGMGGLIMLAAGHFISGNFMGKKLAADVARAKAMVAAGKGKEKAEFNDINQREMEQLDVTAEIYQSWFDPEGPANMRDNAANLGKDVAVLWVAGEHDRVASKVLKRLVYDEMSGNPKNRFVIVDGGHRDTPDNAPAAVIDWLMSLK